MRNLAWFLAAALVGASFAAHALEDCTPNYHERSLESVSVDGVAQSLANAPSRIAVNVDDDKMGFRFESYRPYRVIPGVEWETVRRR